MFHGDSMFCIYQDPMNSLNSSVKVGKQLYQMAKGYKKMTRAEFDQQMGIILERIKFEDPMRTLNKYPFELSGGMLQRAALASALANDPSVLLLDEPLGALDAFTRMRLQDELIRIWQWQKNTMLMITHDIDEAVYLAQKVIILTPRPSQIQKELAISLPYPRDRTSSEFVGLRNEILETLHFV